MKIFRKALLIIIVLTVTATASGALITKASDTVYPDLTEDSVYYPHIKKFSDNFFVSKADSAGNYISNGTVTRADIAKMVAYTRLAELNGIKDGWSGMNKLSMALEILSLLQDSFNCKKDACVSIGGVPFTDVPESNPKCLDDLGNPDACKPWFSRFVYYMVKSGFMKGYPQAGGAQAFRPMEAISRIHALKLIITDNGNVTPEYEYRYKRLLAQAVRLNSYLPKCLIGAENFIKDLNGGNTENAGKLLAYALLADRLDMFGNRCQVFGNAVTPEQRARFLQEPLTRGEMPRYFAITTAYQPIRPDVPDATINTAAQNKGSDAGNPSYSIPPYSPTPAYDPEGGDESVWGVGDTGTAPVKKPVVPVAPDRPVYDKNAPYPPGGTTTSPKATPTAGGTGTQAGQKTGGLKSTADINTCVKKTTKGCITTSLGSCITVDANTRFRTVGELEFGYSIPAYYTSLWQKVMLANNKQLYIPFDDIAMNADIGECGKFSGLIIIASGGNGNVSDTANLLAMVDTGNPASDDMLTGTQSLAGTEYWYTAIRGWQTKDDGLWGGVFSTKRYDKKYFIETLFPEQSSDKNKELIVKVISPAQDYDITDANATANRKNMSISYRTDRWYKIAYTNPETPDDGIKTGYVPVSSVILKDSSLFRVVDNMGNYEFWKSDDFPGGGYSSDGTPVDKLLLHNSNGYSVLGTGYHSVHYYLARNDNKYGDRFVMRVPEYLGTGTTAFGEAESKSISVEMVNVEWYNPAFSKADYLNRIVNNGQFHDFNFEKMNGYDVNDEPKNHHIFTTIAGTDYDLVNYYFNEKNGFFEALNSDDKKLPQSGIDLKKQIKNNGTCATIDNKCIIESEYEVFNRFYKPSKDDKNRNIYLLNKEYKSLVDSGVESIDKLHDIYTVLNKIPFGYRFYDSNKNFTTDFTRAISPKGTYPFQVYRLPSSVRSQAMNDGEDADYYEKYTSDQYTNLDKFIRLMNAKYGIPMETFDWQPLGATQAKYGFYYQEKSSDKIMSKAAGFKGIISHRNTKAGGKMCPAPGFQTDRIPSLNVNNIFLI